MGWLNIGLGVPYWAEVRLPATYVLPPVSSITGAPLMYPPPMCRLNFEFWVQMRTTRGMPRSYWSSGPATTSQTKNSGRDGCGLDPPNQRKPPAVWPGASFCCGAAGCGAACHRALVEWFSLAPNARFLPSQARPCHVKEREPSSVKTRASLPSRSTISSGVGHCCRPSLRGRSRDDHHRTGLAGSTGKKSGERAPKNLLDPKGSKRSTFPFARFAPFGPGGELANALALLALLPFAAVLMRSWVPVGR